MTISLKTQKILWGRAAARCAFVDCRRHLVEDISETDDPTLVGENCHIAAEKDDGPRGNPAMSVDDRNRYGNLVLLCNVHHKIIDDNEKVWTVPALKSLKEVHEKWVGESLGIDQIKLREDSIYADYIDQWSRLVHLESWTAWSSYILGSGQPRIRVEINNDLGELRHWLLGRVWPGRYKTLESAFSNFQRILQDFHEVLQSHLETREGFGMSFTKKFYQIDQWNPELYKKLSKDYDFHVDLVCDLMLELTRAVNLICDEVRRHISYSFRLKEGNAIVQRGPDANFSFTEFVPRYSQDEAKVETPYPGLREFYDDRSNRDWTIGEGRLPK